MDATTVTTVDPRSGYCSLTRTFHSLRRVVELPPLFQPLSVTSYVFSLLPSPLPTHPAFTDASTDASLSFRELHSRVISLSFSLLDCFPRLLSKGQLAFVLAPPSLDVPLLYLSLLDLGVVVSPSNPSSTPHEISHQISLSKPSLAFATSSTAHLLPPDLPTLLLDSPRFRSLLHHQPATAALVSVEQSDTAAVLYSSGTTGRTKAVAISHRNVIAFVASTWQTTREMREREGKGADTHSVSLFTVPLFHVFGMSFLVRSVALGETAVLMGGRFDFLGMLRAVERYRVGFMPVSPPVVVAMAKHEAVARHDLSSLEGVGSGGAPLGRDIAERFAARFPNVRIGQGYGLTESTSAASGTYSSEEAKVYGSAGKIAANLEAKIVDPTTGEALPPGKQGELWLRGPTIMLGYLGDEEANAATLHPEGWLKTGDLCYIDHDGFLFIVDRLKELIKYKAYQVPPAELEHVLLSHPGVADVAVVPHPNEEAGEIPLAFIVRQPGSTLNEEQVIDFVAKRVAPYKKIRRVAFIDAIPKNPSGKILRRELVKHALAPSKSKL